jgi:hypothetical protein
MFTIHILLRASQFSQEKYPQYTFFIISEKRMTIVIYTRQRIAF